MSTTIPYTFQDILNYLQSKLPNEDLSLVTWLEKEFDRFTQLGRKLPKIIQSTTLDGWIITYKNHTGSGRGPGGSGSGRRVLHLNKSIQ